MGFTISELREHIIANSLPPVPEFLADPTDMQHLLLGSIGVTVLVDRLFEFKPDWLPGLEIWPAAEDNLFRAEVADRELRDSLGIGPSAAVIVYHGNVHPANIKEVRSLYLAVGALARENVDIVLVRLGQDSVPGSMSNLMEFECPVISVPFQPRERLPRYLALADLFVQPGRLDDFNAYRFPSKLPEFFAMGRPVILPATNIGLAVEDGQDAILVRRGDALELADKIKSVISNRDLSVKLSKGARAFYERMFSWRKTAEKLQGFYEELNVQPFLNDLRNDIALSKVASHYSNYTVPQVISYATVRDYSDGIDHLPALAQINQDLKDAQRPWVFKAILAMVPRGAKLLEIGAGDPWVADLLTRLGYEVTVVDPYDGRARGPAEFIEIKRQFPRIDFRRGLFPDVLDQTELKKFDCIYSISVLEHVPNEAISAVFAGIEAFSKNNSVTIHAIDHVLLGNGADNHYDKLKEMIRCLGIDEIHLEKTFITLRDDPDAYFLSAEAHNRWRGTIAYDEFPMRRCVSMQICCRLVEGRYHANFDAEDD